MLRWWAICSAPVLKNPDVGGESACFNISTMAHSPLLIFCSETAQKLKMTVREELWFSQLLSGRKTIALRQAWYAWASWVLNWESRFKSTSRTTWPSQPGPFRRPVLQSTGGAYGGHARDCWVVWLLLLGPPGSPWRHSFVRLSRMSQGLSYVIAV